MAGNAIKMDATDNVAVATHLIGKGQKVVIGEETVCTAAEDIKEGHKVALVPIPSGGKVIRYGEVIVETIKPIACGEWIHVHNTRPVLKEL